MVAGAASLVLQLVLTGRVLRVFGVGVALFVVPVAMASASLGVILFGTLVAASALKASDQVLRYSIDKATVELLYLPLSAAETFRVKSFIDTVVYRLGDGLGGLAVLACAAWMGWNPMQVGWVTLAAIGAWMAAAAAARTRYVTNLQESIRQHRVEGERAYAPILDRNATQALAAQLRGSPDEILYALSLFESANVVHPAVPGLLAHESPEVRKHAVALLSNSNVMSVRREVEKLLHDPSLEVRTEALLYMTRLTNADPLTLHRAARRLPGLLDPRRHDRVPGPARPRPEPRGGAAAAAADGGGGGGRRAAQPDRGGAGDWHRARRVRPRATEAARGRCPGRRRARRSVRPGCWASGSSRTGSSTTSRSRR